MTVLKKPVFSKQAFWSDDVTKLNKDTHADHIIARVFDAGTFDDMSEAVRYYGKERIQKALTTATELQSSTIAHAAIWLELRPLDFKAHNRKLINPQPWENEL